MSTEKKWIKGKRDMYTKVPTRGARAGKTCYWARVWIKSRQEFAHFYLGLKPKAAQERLDQMLGNPEAALAERQQDRTVVLTFEQALALFLANYIPRGGTTVYYRENLSGPRKFFRECLLTDITSAALDEYVKDRRALVRQKDGQRRVGDSTSAST